MNATVKDLTSRAGLFVCGLAVLLSAGCSAHQNPPLTPTDSATTPTFRSSTNSYDQPNTPLYTQPGINTGHVTNLPAIPKHERWDQNAPLALAVVGAITPLGQTNVNYVAVQSKGSSVMLGGTVPSKAVEQKVLAAARGTKGVTKVVSNMTIQAP